MEMKQLDFGLAWKEAVRLFTVHLDIGLAIAGVFFLLPALLLGWFGTPLDAKDAKSAEAIIALLSGWMRINWYWLVTSFVFTSIGTLALYMVVLAQDRPTVQNALGAATLLFPFYFLTQLLTGLATFAGFLLLIIPGIYLGVKFMFAAPVMAVEKVRNPFDAIARSWSLTKNNSVLIFMFIVMITVAAIILAFGVELIINLPLALLLAPETAAPITILVSSVMQSLTSLFILFVIMALYRQLAATRLSQAA